MIYLLFVAIAAVSTAAICLFCARKGVADPGEKLNLFKSAGEDIEPFRGKKLALILLICFAAATAVQISLYKNTDTVNLIKLFGVFVIVAAAAMVDAKRRIIPNILIIIGLAFRLVIYAYEIISHADLKSILINDLIGLAIGFGILAVVSLLTHGSVGFGDAKLFAVIGITCGSFCTFSTLLLSLIISTIVAVVGLARKKIDKKSAIPFGPCIAAGYTIALLLTSY